MITMLLLIGGCLLGLILLAGLIIGVMIIMQSDQRDVVSEARQGWIFRRSEKDEEGW